MKHKAEKYARDTAARMRQSGFSHYESERVRSYIENAYQAGYKAGRAKAGPITEDVIMRGGIAEDIILKTATQ